MRSNPITQVLKFAGLGLVLFNSHTSLAQSDEVSVNELSFLDRSHIQRQIDKIEEVTRRNFGSGLHGSPQDLNLIQRVIDRGLIDTKDRLQLQALGAVIGDVLVNDQKLEWKVYEDRRGRSRATCVKASQTCIFPITLLSRRMEVGLLPRVQDVYNKALAMIESERPQNPYAKKYEPAPKLDKSSL